MNYSINELLNISTILQGFSPNSVLIVALSPHLEHYFNSKDVDLNVLKLC